MAASTHHENIPSSQFELGQCAHVYNLCHEAEHFLHNDIKNERVGLINETLLMKERGYPVGLAIRDLSVPGGVIQAGWWYQLADNALRKEVYNVFDSGDRRVRLLGAVALVENRKMRETVGSISMSGQELFDMAAFAAEALGGQRVHILGRS